MRVVEQKITWRGNSSDLATDVAALFTLEEGAQFVKDFVRLLTEVPSKFLGEGFVGRQATSVSVSQQRAMTEEELQIWRVAFSLHHHEKPHTDWNASGVFADQTVGKFRWMRQQVPTAGLIVFP